jgi:hypothetical protein
MGKRGRPSRVRTRQSSVTASNEQPNSGTVQCLKCNAPIYLSGLHIHNKHCQGLGVPPEEELTDDELQLSHNSNRIIPPADNNHLYTEDSNSDVGFDVHQDDESSSRPYLDVTNAEEGPPNSDYNPHNYAHDHVHRHELEVEQAIAGDVDDDEKSRQTYLEPNDQYLSQTNPQVDTQPHLPMSMNVRPGDFDDQIERNSKENPLKIPIYSSHFTNQDRSKMGGMALLGNDEWQRDGRTSVYSYFLMVPILPCTYLMLFWHGLNILRKYAAPGL